MEKSFNPLGNTRREQWHTVVKMLRMYDDDMSEARRNGFYALCDSIDDYIDGVENVLENMEMED